MYGQVTGGCQNGASLISLVDVVAIGEYAYYHNQVLALVYSILSLVPINS